MARIIYAVWGENIHDNRNKHYFEIEDDPDLNEFDEFDPGTGIKGFISGKGFIVFDKDINLINAFYLYIKRAAEESCGKCTPCRVGLQMLAEKFETILESGARSDDLSEIEQLADHIKRTSLCGLGQSSTTALTYALEHFRDEFERALSDGRYKKVERGTSYVTAPCIEACPAKVDVPKYIDYIKDGKFTHSVGVVLQKYPWAATCGRVCVRFCELACRRTMVDEPVGIKVLKRFVADREKYVTDNWFSKDLIEDEKPADLKVAVIGSGPASISAAYHLLLRGYNVDIYEAHSKPGGMAAVGIPNYRLPEEILSMEISIIESLGGTIYYGKRLGSDFFISDLLQQGYKSIFLGVGAHQGKILRVPGEDRTLEGYKLGIDYLLLINHQHINLGEEVELGNKVVVVGGGNVAMDCVRSALRMGANEAHLIYRRTKDEMPADPEEIEAAEKEGVIFHYLSHPTRILSENGRVTGMELTKMKLDLPGKGGRASVVPIEGSEFTLEADFIIPAIGQQVDLSFLQENDGIAINKWGFPEVNPSTLMTDMKGIFAGGDCVTGPATLIEAMAQGERAARSIDDYLTYGKVRFSTADRMSELLAALRKHLNDEIKIPIQVRRRLRVQELDPAYRKRIFEEVEKPISIEEAYTEAERCLRCYRVILAITDR